jgi:hypothetical protein
MSLRALHSAATGPAPRPTPDVILGSAHPLVGDLERLAVVARQSIAVGVLLVVSAGAAIGITAQAWAVALSSAVVLVTLFAVAAVVRGRERAHALQLIREGRERLPVAAVEHERWRLVDARTRSRLADSLDDMVQSVATPRRRDPRPVPPILHRRVVADVVQDLECIATLLRSQTALARGVALVEWLLTEGLSPLYGDDVAALREELRRVQFLLTV